MTYFHPVRALIVGICIGLSGLCVAMTLQGFDTEMRVAAFVAAFLSGLLMSPMFGRRGNAGYGWAMLGAVCATVLGGALGAGIYETDIEIFLLGAIFVPLSIIADPVSATVWIISMSLTHVVTYTGTEMARLG